MNKHKNIIAAMVSLIIVAIAIGLVLINHYQTKNEANSSKTGEMILFYSLACPHCQNLEQYIEANKIKEKYTFSQLEVSADKQNNAKLLEKARVCGVNTQGVGVPFLWTGEKCLMGDTEIIDFFKK